MKVGSGINNSNTLSQVQKQQEQAMKQLAAGLKINSAQDDAAGLQIAKPS